MSRVLRSCAGASVERSVREQITAESRRRMACLRDGRARVLGTPWRYRHGLKYTPPRGETRVPPCKLVLLWDQPEPDRPAGYRLTCINSARSSDRSKELSL